jgi:glycosidase
MEELKNNKPSFTASGPPKWVQEAIFYEIFPDRFNNGDPSNDPIDVVPWETSPSRTNFFGGDLQGIIDKLPYLEDLGVGALYLTPIFKANTNHRYDISDYLEIDASFGSLDIMKRLVSESHNRGIRVILDAVFNHSGYDFWAFEDVRNNGPLSKYVDWYYINSFPIQKNPPNYQTCARAWDLPKLNTNNPEVREYLLNVATYWINQCGIDGWRVDTPYKVPMDFWRELREKVKTAKRDAYIVGEVWRYHHLWLKGDTFDGVMNYPLREHILAYIIDGWMDSEDFNIENEGLRDIHEPFAHYQLNLLGSHDTSRVLTLCNGDVDVAIMAAVFLFTYLGVPMIYYGDEIGLLGGRDPDCRRTMRWNESSWDEKIYRTYKELIRFREKHPALRFGDLVCLYTFDSVYAFRREFESDIVIVVLNRHNDLDNLKIPIEEKSTGTRIWQDMITDCVFYEVNGSINIDRLTPKTALILTHTD